MEQNIVYKWKNAILFCYQTISALPGSFSTVEPNLFLLTSFIDRPIAVILPNAND